MNTAHLADDRYRPLVTLCGLQWEPWQEPEIPTDEEIGFDSLSYAAKVAVREADRFREPWPDESVRQCPACLKSAVHATPQP